jgi:hypothetical protein
LASPQPHRGHVETVTKISETKLNEIDFFGFSKFQERYASAVGPSDSNFSQNWKPMQDRGDSPTPSLQVGAIEAQ